jgi:transcription termination/antitermination protein NusG
MSRWYIIHAYSGFENKVRDSILAEATRMGLDALVEAVEVPTEKVTEVRRGKKVTSDRKFFPGYVLAKLSMSDDVYHLIKNTPKVTGFLGTSGKPQPISDAEAARILNTKDEAAAAAPKARISVDYEIGDQVKVLEGPFASFNGVVEELDFDRSRVKVGVSIFGRATPVELEFEQVERADGHEGLVSEDAAAASRQSLAALSALRQREAAPADGGPLEAVVRDMLRPILKDWLDENLPQIVEELVTREISRITGRKL